MLRLCAASIALAGSGRALASPPQDGGEGEGEERGQGRIERVTLDGQVREGGGSRAPVSRASRASSMAGR